MWNFQDTFETRKRSFIRVFSNCMAVPLHLQNLGPDYFEYTGMSY